MGPRKYYFELAEEKDRIGITTGLVWTEVGGDIISVEAVKMQGKQKLILTGSLGDVMRESAQAALSYIRSNASKFGISENFFENNDIHIHVPAGLYQKTALLPALQLHSPFFLCLQLVLPEWMLRSAPSLH